MVARIPGLRGLCDTCKHDVLVRADGKLRYHGPHPSPCPGGGTHPTALQAPGGKWRSAPQPGTTTEEADRA